MYCLFWTNKNLSLLYSFQKNYYIIIDLQHSNLGPKFECFWTIFNKFIDETKYES